MDALQMLREDHRKVKELFRQFEEAEGKNEKRAIAETVFVELDIHSVLEEEVFYPAVRRQGNGTGELVERAEQEHHLVDSLLADLMEMEPGNMEFDAKFHTLIESVKSHIDEEEAEMLPVAAEVGLSRLERLGDRMEQRRAELLSEGQSGRQRVRTRPVTTGTTKTQRVRSASTTRARPTTATRSKATVSSRESTTTRARPKTSRGKKSAAAVRRGASRAPATNGAKTTATRTRTVAQAGTRKRTTQTRSRMSGRRSGSQSGR
jgi:hemerythrin-like domain-containing protein